MNYFEGNEFFLLLFVVLLIGFVVNFFEKRKDYYILTLSLLFAAAIYGKSRAMMVYLACLCRLSIFSGFSSTEDRSKEAETTGFPFYSSFSDQ